MSNGFSSGQSERGSSRTLEGVANSLGWFSIALGAAEMFAPRALAKLIGIREQPVLLPALGLREITSGIGILAQPHPTGWMWSRVAGDALDLALLGVAYLSDDSDEERVEAAAAAVGGVTVLDLICAFLLTRSSSRTRDRSVRIAQTITIGRSPEELYAFWRKYENLPRIMRHLQSVRQTGSNTSHWVAKSPAGTMVEWDAETTEDRPNESIAWRSLPGADIDNSGCVRFQRAPGGRGTVVRVELEYTPPGGIVGAKLAKLFGRSPEHQIQIDLYRLKQIIETGQAITTQGQPAGRMSSTSHMYDGGTTRG